MNIQVASIFPIILAVYPHVIYIFISSELISKVLLGIYISGDAAARLMKYAEEVSERSHTLAFRLSYSYTRIRLYIVLTFPMT